MAQVKKYTIGLKATGQFKKQLEILAEHDKRTLSDFIRLELEKIIQNEQSQEILKNYKNTKEKSL